MKKILFIPVLVLIVIIIMVVSDAFQRLKPADTQPLSRRAEDVSNMQISSSAFENGKEIPSSYACDGINVNPPLIFNDVPPETKSLAILVDDPDAPGGNFIHWLIWNIDPKTRELKQGDVPSNSVQGKNGFGQEKYQGPCPPSGTHKYKFTLFALDTMLDLPSGSGKNEFLSMIEGRILEESILTGTYFKK